MISSPPPHARGRKRALIVGISYKHTIHELEGFINDARCTKHMLINRFEFPESFILMLTGKKIIFFYFLSN